MTAPYQPFAVSYDWPIVVLSLVLAVLASYTAFDVASRIATASGPARFGWLAGASVAFGVAAWTMPFTGLLASQNVVREVCAWPAAVGSFVPAALGAGLGLFFGAGRRKGWATALLASAAMAGGIVGANYLGVASLRQPIVARYSPGVVLLSILLASLFCLLSWRAASFLGRDASKRDGCKLAAALLLGAAIAGGHYTGIAAATFVPVVTPALVHTVGVAVLGGLAVPLTVLLVLVAAIATCFADRSAAERVLQAQMDRSMEQLHAMTARLQEVREEERVRVARELHDDLAQTLTGIRTELASLAGDAHSQRETDSRRLDAMRAFVDEGIQMLRRIATESLPAIFDRFGLVAAIEWATDDFQARTGITAHVAAASGEVGIDRERAVAVFRIVQETLTSVTRHAKATHVDVRIAADRGDLVLEVHDNGEGFAESRQPPAAALGILAMRERAALLGGSLDVAGAPGRGTTVTVRLPGLRETEVEREVR